MSALPIPAADQWVPLAADEAIFDGLELVWALGRFGDVFGPLPFALINPAAWAGEMFNASLDLVAYARCDADYRAVVPLTHAFRGSAS